MKQRRKWSREEMEEVLKKYESFDGEKSEFYTSNGLTRSQFYAMKRRYQLASTSSQNKGNIKHLKTNLISIIPSKSCLTLELSSNMKLFGNPADIAEVIIQLGIIK